MLYCQEDQTRYCTWSVAHGIRHGSWSLPGNSWGNEEENAGAACTGGKLTLPM